MAAMCRTKISSHFTGGSSNRTKGILNTTGFAKKASLVVRESATFLIRLFAHEENGPIMNFKEALWSVLKCCEQCVCGFQEAKASSRTRCLS